MMNQNIQGQGNVIKETTNKVFIVGALVKNGLEVINEGEENEAIRGSLTLRTADGSEHDVQYYANRYKKSNGSFTNELNPQFDTLLAAKEDFIDMSNEYGEPATVIKIGGGSFRANDYMSKNTGSLVSTFRINASFANKLEGKDLELNPQNAKFEVSGIITKIEPEMKNGNPTGNQLLSLDTIGYGGAITPLTLTIPSDLVQPFSGAGFYVGAAGKFNGNIVNSAKKEEIVEQQSFGDPVVKTVTTYNRMLEIRGGSPLTLDGLGITNEQYEMCKNKRQAHLNEIRTKAQQGGQQNGATQNAFGQPPVQNVNNPFGQAQVNVNNPFGGVQQQVAQNNFTQQNVNNPFNPQ